MAVARPPSYSSYNRKRKPIAMMSKKKPLSFNSTGPTVASKPQPKPVVKALTPIKKPTPGTGGLAAPAPKAPTLQAVPQLGMAAAPPGMQTTSDRISAREQYGQGMNDINRAIMDAAMRYGGVTSVQQFGYDPAGKDTSSTVGVTSNPEDNSALSVIARNAALQGRHVDEAASTDNTFFSTRRLGDLQEINSDADRQRAAAKADYDAAIANYISNITGLRSGRDESMRNASIADIMAAQENAPTNQIPQQGAATPPRPAVAAPKPKAGFKYVQADGPRKGQSYNLIFKNGRYYRRYEDGDTVAR